MAQYNINIKFDGTRNAKVGTSEIKPDTLKDTDKIISIKHNYPAQKDEKGNETTQTNYIAFSGKTTHEAKKTKVAYKTEKSTEEEKTSNGKTTTKIKKDITKVSTESTIETTYEGIFASTFVLNDVNYEKRIYQPGHAEVTLTLTTASGSLTTTTKTTEEITTEVVSEKDSKPEKTKKELTTTNSKTTDPTSILSYFLNGALLSIERNNGSETTSEYPVVHYIISHISLEDKKGTLTFTIDAYSPDYLLNKDKYSKVYTGKKIYQDIILAPTTGNSPFWPNSLKDMIDFSNNTEGTLLTDDNRTKPYVIRENFSRLRYFTWNSNQEFEYIHPYLVQYEESPYNFMVRTLNRCGEFFYFEKGAFIFGWIDPSLITSYIKKRDSAGQIIQEKDAEGNVTTEYLTNMLEPLDTYGNNNIFSLDNYQTNKTIKSTIKVTDTPKPSEDGIIATEISSTDCKSITRNGSMASSEDIKEIAFDYLKKADTSGMTDEEKAEAVRTETVSADGKYIVSAVSNDEYLSLIPEEDGYVSLGGDIRWEKTTFNAVMNALNQPNVGAMISNLLYTDGLVMSASLQGNAKLNQTYKMLFWGENQKYLKERYDTTDDKKKLRQFSTGGDQLPNDIAESLVFAHPFYEQNATGIRKAEDGRITINLGTTYANLYLGSVIKVYNQFYIVDYIKDNCKTSDATDYVIEGIPFDENADIVYPPMVNNNVFYRKCKGPQRAIITDNWDPLRMNRVRIKYKWQSEAEDASPWIRIALPMASKSSGFNFTPAKGDEAIIGYENDNIEKPYIIGMVYNQDKRPPKGFSAKRDSNLSITSRNGHSVIFTDTPNANEAWKAFMPGVNFISKVLSFPLMAPTAKGIGKIENTETSDTFKKAIGGVQIADSIGFYSLDMSTDKRAITIKSSLGQITLSAFTGITISAPNGDVTIQGKNVKIVAGNDITMTSGTYQNPYVKGKTHGEQAKEIFKTIGLGLLGRLQPVDMKLLRTIFEAFLRPVGGRTLIKAIGNLCMEAGSPKTIANPLGYDADYEHYVDFYRDLQKVINVTKTLHDKVIQISEWIDDTISGLSGPYKSIEEFLKDGCNFSALKTNELKMTDIFPELIEGGGLEDDYVYLLSKYVKRLNACGVKDLYEEVNKDIFDDLTLDGSPQIIDFIKKHKKDFMSPYTKREEKISDYYTKMTGLPPLYTYLYNQDDYIEILYKIFKDLLKDYSPKFKTITIKCDKTFQKRHYEGNELIGDSIDAMKVETEPYNLSKRRKARNAIEQAWDLGNYKAEFYRQGKYTGNILYASGEQGSPTCVINKNGIERIAYPTSASIIMEIKSLLKDEVKRQNEKL